MRIRFNDRERPAVWPTKFRRWRIYSSNSKNRRWQNHSIHKILENTKHAMWQTLTTRLCLDTISEWTNQSSSERHFNEHPICHIKIHHWNTKVSTNNTSSTSARWFTNTTTIEDQWCSNYGPSNFTQLQHPSIAMHQCRPPILPGHFHQWNKQHWRHTHHSTSIQPRTDPRLSTQTIITSPTQTKQKKLLSVDPTSVHAYWH